MLTVSTEQARKQGGPLCRLPLPQLWELPPATVMVQPCNAARFWDVVRKKAMEVGNWDLTETLGVPVDSDTPTLDAEGMPSTFPIELATPGSNQPNQHVGWSWKVVQDMQKAVAQYGPNSPAVTQLLRLLNLEVLVPYDFQHLAQIMFQPVQHSVFMNIWRQRADHQALQNMQLPQGDPCYGAGTDVLMGMGQVFGNPAVQVQWHPQILAQVKKIGMQALMHTAEMAEPKAKYTTIKQGAKEPFLQFVEKLQGTIEKQVFDANLRTLLTKQLAKDNANPDCQRLIETLPGDPTLEDMVTACAKVGSVEHKMSALATALAALHVKEQKCFGCRNLGHIKSECPELRVQKVKATANVRKRGVVSGSVAITCHRYGKTGHFAKQFHINGQPIQRNGKKSAKGCAQTQMPYSPGNPFAGAIQHQQYNPQINTQTHMTNYQGKQSELPGWMYPPPTQ